MAAHNFYLFAYREACIDEGQLMGQQQRPQQALVEIRHRLMRWLKIKGREDFEC
ncbi:hypothetical protein [Modicisalibacter ilicicola]|uniref:hypothetical protein n=1 Tax=Modicisalibacter ilicicola TaxID=480814 RepID=UPI001587258E|nr:hypothetical protein [Halomonas ilicicola]